MSVVPASGSAFAAGPTGSRVLNRAIAGVMVLGVGLRLWHYFSARSLWIDEARLALNIGARGYAGLLMPLDYDQSAPPLFLAIEKLASQVLGMDELSLRLFPLIAGIGLLPLTYLLARPLLSRAGLLILLTITAIAPVLVYYSNELKPYISDAAVTAMLLILARRAMYGSSRKWLTALAGAGVVATWLSAPSIFVLVGIGVSWLLSPHISKDRAVGGASVAVAWLASFMLAYAGAYRTTASNEYLRTFWAYRMLDPGRPDLGRRVWFAVREVLAGLLAGTASGQELTNLWATLSHALTAVGLLLVLIGGARLHRRVGRFEAGLIEMPLLVALAAAIGGLYPIALRLMLFSAPSLLVLLVAGAGAVLARVNGYTRYAATVALGAMLSFLPYYALLGAVQPTRWEDARSIIRQLITARKRGEAVYIDAGALPAWVFYSTSWSSPDQARLDFAARIGSSGGPSFENAPPRGRPVTGEGDALVYAGPAGPEVYGLFTGMQWRWGVSLSQSKPDGGWAANESRRMMSCREESWWALFTHDFGSSYMLRTAFVEAGARQDFAAERGRTQLIHYSKP